MSTQKMNSVSGKMQLDLLPKNIPSMCIPKVFPSISRRRIEDTFADLRIGILERVDIVSKTAKNGEKYNTVFVHLREWNVRDAYAREMREALMLENGSVNITYDRPYFWKVVANQAVHADRSRPAERPTIQINTPSVRCAMPSAAAAVAVEKKTDTQLLNEELKRRLAIAEKEILETIERERLQIQLEADALLEKQRAEMAELEEEERKFAEFAELVEANVKKQSKSKKSGKTKKNPLTPEEQKQKAAEASALNREKQLRQNAELKAQKAKSAPAEQSYYCRQDASREADYENVRKGNPHRIDYSRRGDSDTETRLPEDEDEDEDEQAVEYPTEEPEKIKESDGSARGAFHQKMCTPAKPWSGYFDVDAPREEAFAIDYGPAILPPSIKFRREQKAKRLAEAAQEAEAAEEENRIEQAAQELEDKLYAGL